MYIISGHIYIHAYYIYIYIYTYMHSIPKLPYTTFHCACMYIRGLEDEDVLYLLSFLCPALEMRTCQVDLERVEGQLEKRSQDVRELQARLQDAEKLLVSTLSETITTPC